MLVQLTLNEKLDKAPAVRLSKWSATVPSDAQTKYAALDAIKTLEVYEHLHHLPDLTLRLCAENAIPNMKVDAVPSQGNDASMATRGACGSISEERVCNCPNGVLP